MTHETPTTVRRFKHSPEFRREHPAARAFIAPQRPRPAKVQHPKPQCGMCGGKIHTRTDYRAPDEPAPYPGAPRPAYAANGDPGWWLCRSCDTGPEVGRAVAA